MQSQCLPAMEPLQTVSAPLTGPPLAPQVPVRSRHQRRQTRGRLQVLSIDVSSLDLMVFVLLLCSQGRPLAPGSIRSARLLPPQARQESRGFRRRGGGGSIEAPKTGGLGKGLNGQDNQSVIMNPGAQGPENFLSIQHGQIVFLPNTWQMTIFLNPLDALIPKIPFSFFASFWVRVTSGAFFFVRDPV